ncbi:MAG: ADP-ribosylglycohydrolase family protein [Clostridia bacterium]|nr:ADP-ribosylglycohydrolase family protein [Clostridia bacterium]
MMTYETYLDKVYGCFLGKTVAGTMGAPYEGIKMPLELQFKPEMINTMLPNDDLDLQVLWLDVVKKYGENFSSYDLQQCFCENCDYSPGEYAIMRKNYEKGIYPPESGRFCNDFYIEGMGCPIRSEIWACLYPAQPAKAAETSTMDGCLDHDGESVYAEKFFAALESAAFYESDLYKLIDIALCEIPDDCKLRTLITDTLAWCERYDDVKTVLKYILHKYGHPDCTNLFQNIGITLTALLKGNMDLIKTSMDALNCGFDTDCTCATAGAVIGVIRGAKSLIEEYDLGDVKFVLGVRSPDHTDSVYDLSCEIAQLGAHFAPFVIENAPEKAFVFEKRDPLVFDVSYPEGPSISFGQSKTVTLSILNTTEKEISTALCVTGFGTMTCHGIGLSAGKSIELPLTFSVPTVARELYERNLITVGYTLDDKEYGYTFGLSGAAAWKVTGPIWKTDPICTTEALEKVPNYWHLFAGVQHDGDSNDIVRRFHLNYAVDTDTEYLTEEQLFAAPCEDGKYVEEVFVQEQDSFTMDDLFGFKGPCVAYLSRVMLCPEDMEVCVQVGHSAPFALYINGDLIAERKNCDTWTAENVHVQHVQLKKGENRVVLRLTRVNADAKYNLIFSKGPTCATHYVCMGSVNPYRFS